MVYVWGADHFQCYIEVSKAAVLESPHIKSLQLTQTLDESKKQENRNKVRARQDQRKQNRGQGYTKYQTKTYQEDRRGCGNNTHVWGRRPFANPGGGLRGRHASTQSMRGATPNHLGSPPHARPTANTSPKNLLSADSRYKQLKSSLFPDTFRAMQSSRDNSQNYVD